MGNSLGIVIPLDIIKKTNLKEGDEITIFLQNKKSDLRKLFGVLKDRKIDAQKFKDEIREEELKNN